LGIPKSGDFGIRGGLTCDKIEGGGSVVSFALSIFLSAFLLLQIQPMIGKFLLPWFGGTPAICGWTITAISSRY
jgi:hypothetical protein